QFDGAGGGGEEVALEAVEVLDGEGDLVGPGVLGGAAHDVGRALPLVVGGAGAGEDADGGVVGTAQVVAAEDGGGVEGPLQVVEGLLAHAGVGADRIAALTGVADGDGGAGQAEVVEFLAYLPVVAGVAAEDGQLDAVEAGGLQLGEQREVLLGDVGGP